MRNINSIFLFQPFDFANRFLFPTFLVLETLCSYPLSGLDTAIFSWTIHSLTGRFPFFFHLWWVGAACFATLGKWHLFILIYRPPSLYSNLFSVDQRWLHPPIVILGSTGRRSFHRKAHDNVCISKETFTGSKSTIKSSRRKCEICSKLKVKTLERRLFIVNFEHISHIFPVFLLLTSNT